MNQETKVCQNCHQSFTLIPNDFEIFKKMEVDAPSLCADCGVGRMMALRNERVLYKGVCAKCSKSTLSLYAPGNPYTIYCHDCWWSDGWDPGEYAQDYDSSRPLFDQFKELQLKVPREAVIIVNSPGCDFTNSVRDSKNCYFCFLMSFGENVYYSMWVVSAKDCIDNRRMLDGCELVAHSINISKCYRSTYLQDCTDCNDCHFSFDLRGCTNCLFSYNLRNKSYCINNEQLSREEYERRAKELLDGSYATLQDSLKKFEELKEKALRRYSVSIKCNDAVGGYLTECNRCTWIFDGVKDEDCRYVASILNAKNVLYSYSIGTQPGEYHYGSCVLKGGMNNKFCFNLLLSARCALSDSLLNSSDCIASVGLKNKQYYILNKQYTKEEYEKIYKQIKEKGELRDFPPKEFSTFAYNETAAQEYQPLSKEQALSRGYRWQDDFQLTTGQETIKSEQIPDKISDVKDEIAKEVFACIACQRNYRITPQEIGYYRILKLPIPRQCPQCRFDKRQKQLLPFRLWHRQCMCDYEIRKNDRVHDHHQAGRCPNEFETSYAPERKEIVYCEACYNAEVV